MKTVIIRQHTKNGLQKIITIKERNGEYFGEVLNDIRSLIDITIVTDNNSRIKL